MNKDNGKIEKCCCGNDDCVENIGPDWFYNLSTFSAQVEMLNIFNQVAQQNPDLSDDKVWAMIAPIPTVN